MRATKGSRVKSIFVCLLLLVGAVGITLLTIPSHRAKPSSRQSPTAPAPQHQPQFRGLPTSLEIPAIGVKSGVEYTGLTPTGDMKAPSNPTGVAWYKYGAIPGEKGSAVIAGHVVGPTGQPAVFANLHKLHSGDTIQVLDSKNLSAVFVVREVRVYNQHDQHDEVFNSGNGTHLNIISCAGDWDAIRHQYVDRLVVFADLSSKS